MNREILFRGKRYDGKGWVYGTPFYVKDENKCFIIDNCQSLYLTQEDSVFKGKEVVYNSVGQFTGLTDKNGVKIFEGDNVKIVGTNITYIVEYKFATFWISKPNGHFFTILDDHHCSFEVIGNIHDNPELIK